MSRSVRRWVAVACLTAATVACTDEAAAPPRPAEGSAAEEEVDASLEPRSIAVRGRVVVGEPLTAVVSPDLDGKVQDWGWHRCLEPPACLTIPGADGPGYVPTADDAWQLLRVIAVAERPDGSSGAVETRVGPVVNPDPRPFSQEATIDPSAAVGVVVIVAPGPVTITIDAACPVELVAAVLTPNLDGGSDPSDEVTSSAAAEHHDVHLDGEGGQLRAAVVGDCDEAHVTVEASR